MSLSSLSFIGTYFPALLIAYNLPIRNSRNIVLLLASLGLYAIGQPDYIFLLMGSIVINYLLVELSFRKANNVYRKIAIIIDVLMLLGFKYVNIVLAKSGIVANVLFPLGLSYFTFKEISYVVDVKPYNRPDLMQTALYISNFLTIVSGPLYQFSDEIKDIKKAGTSDYEQGFERLISGLAKKIIIADSLKQLVDTCFAGSELSVLMAWVGGIAYSLQLYFDFSGYSDMAIGVGHFFGYNIPENFNLPYIANSISDFWKRWHISLTAWFTRYIYIPLGGSRVNKTRHILNLLVVWIVTGIWHGSKLTFILWAMIYFVLQALEKYSGFAKSLNKIHLGHLYTLTVVVIEWVIFRSDSLSSALIYVSSMFGLRNNALFLPSDLQTILYYKVPLLVGVLLSLGLFRGVSEKKDFKAIYRILLIGLFILSLVIMIGRGYSAPLYAGF